MNERFDYNKEKRKGEKTLIKNICLDIYTSKKYISQTNKQCTRNKKEEEEKTWFLQTIYFSFKFYINNIFNFLVVSKLR